MGGPTPFCIYPSKILGFWVVLFGSYGGSQNEFRFGIFYLKFISKEYT